MPELPEVESVRRSLIPHILNHRIEHVVVNKEKMVASHTSKRTADPEKTRQFIQGQKGAQIVDVHRIGKHIIIELDQGALLIHLRMTGKLLFYTEDQHTKHARIVWTLDHGYMAFDDVRMFGSVLYYQTIEEVYQQLEHIGIDPTEDLKESEKIIKRLSSSKKQIKALLLDQHIVAGLGNIYVDEVLFASKVRPIRQANTISKKLYTEILNNSQQILKAAIEVGGSSIADYVNSNGERGGYAKYHKVYGRAGKPCVECGSILLSTKIAQRTTVYCLQCQK